MAATTTDREATKYDERVRAFPVAAATTLYLGTGIAINSSGYAVSASDSSAVKFVGIAVEGVINTTAEGYGTNGDLDIRVYTRGIHAMVSAGLAITDNGDTDLYWADNQTVQKAPTNLYAGKLARYTSATEALLDIAPALLIAPTSDDTDQLELPVAAAEAIAAGDNVGRDSDGYVLAANDAAAVEFVGIALEAADNSAGADGAINCFIQRSGLVTLVTTGAAITDGDRPVFVNAAATVKFAPADRNLFVGVMVKYISATSIVVDLKPGMLGQCGDVVAVGVAAAKTVTALEMVALDADGYLVDADDTTAVSFWGIALTGAVNTAGADGDLTVWVARSGLFQLTGAGLGTTDTGKEVYQVTDAVTVTTTPGDILVGVLEYVTATTVAMVRIKPMPIVGQRTDRQFTIPAEYYGAVGHVSVNAFTDMEFLRKYVVLAAHADCQVAPGGAYVNTVTLNDGATTFALTITGSAVHGENKTPAPTDPMLITDTDCTMIDDNASGATESVKAVFFCEAL